MNVSTKKTLSISAVFLLAMLALLAFLVIEINRLGVELEETVTVLNNNHSKEKSYQRLGRMVKDSEDARAELAKLFLQDKNDVIAFLQTIEDLAPTLGLELSTKSISTPKAEAGREIIKITFAYKGDKSSVVDFTQIIENIPYYSYISSLRLREISGQEWEGTMDLTIEKII